MPKKVIRMEDGREVTIHVSWAVIFTVLAVIVLLLVVNSSYYTVEANEEGVVLRFGKFLERVPPGLHFKLPLGIDRVEKVKTAFTFKEEFGFRTLRAGRRTRYAPTNRDMLKEALMVTGDLNMAQVEWIVQYRIQDPYKYLFQMRDPEGTLRDLSESIMREVVGDMTVTEVLTEKRAEINSLVKKGLQEAMDSYDSGIRITQVILQDVNPPGPVKDAFDDVNKAQQEREKTINEARQAYNKAVPLAKGDALKMIQEAQGYAIDRVNRALGDVARFSALLEEYRKAPEVTGYRLYMETMEKVLAGLGKKVVLDEEAGKVLPLLNVGREGGGK